MQNQSLLNHHFFYFDYVELIEDAGYFMDTTNIAFLPKSKRISTKVDVEDKFAAEIQSLKNALFMFPSHIRTRVKNL